VRTLNHASTAFASDLADFCRNADAPREVSDAVASILGDVRARGDAAVAEYSEKFDGARLAPGAFRIGQNEIDAAARGLPAADRRALSAAHRAIADFNRRGLPRGWTARNPHGARVGEKFDPIRRVGLYIPGGQVPLVSTVLMTATLARIAGCPQIAAFTPPDAAGGVAPGILAALRLAGVSEVYRIGGAQAIAAMAFGTATIPAVDKIFGPGNAYVSEAKRQVFGRVGIDSIAGPSELMVIADRTARADFAAADLLAQAEHGSGREKIFLVAMARGVAEAIGTEIRAQMGGLARSEKIQRVLDDGFLTIEVATIAQAAEVANYVAPEHLELLVGRRAADRLERAVTTAGAIMIGNETPTALGDFVAGPSHVLPTGRAGRFLGGLRVADFLRRTSLIRYDRAGIARAEPVVARFAAMEKLDAHGKSVSLRAESPRIGLRRKGPGGQGR
jgi:histidinol dehydrogenase